jgi:tape measure domain-containing protein
MEDTRKIYQGAVRAIATMGLSAEQGSRVLYAFQQMVSKGMKGIAEEVNQQLGEVLPGAFGMFAKSVGVSETQLRKMMEQGDLTLNHLVKYGEYLGGNFSGEVSEAVRASNRFNEAWEDLKIQMSESGFMESAASALNDVAETFKDPEVREGMVTMAAALGDLLEVMAKLSKYAGLRSVGNTASEAARLSSEGALGVPLDDFFKKDFFERQKIVDEALNRKNRVARNSFDWKSNRSGFVGAYGDSGNEGKPSQSPLPSFSGEELSKMRIQAIRDEEKARSDMWDEEIKTMNAMIAREKEEWGFVKTSRVEGIREEEQARSDLWQVEIEAMNKAIAKEKAVLTDFNDDYKRATMTTTAYELDQLNQRYDEYAKYVTNKSELDQWYQAEVNNIVQSSTDDWSNAFTGWARDYASNLNDMLWETEVTFEGIARSFAKMITQMMLQKSVIEPLFGSGDSGDGGLFGMLLKNIVGSFSFGGGSVVGDGTSVSSNYAGHVQLHTGGIAGSGEGKTVYGVNPAVFVGAPKFHTGLMPDEFAAVLKKGEGVFTQGQMRALGGMVANNSNRSQQPIIINNISAVDTQSFADAIKRNPHAVNTVVADSIKGNTELVGLIRKVR